MLNGIMSTITGVLIQLGVLDEPPEPTPIVVTCETSESWGVQLVEPRLNFNPGGFFSNLQPWALQISPPGFPSPVGDELAACGASVQIFRRPRPPVGPNPPEPWELIINVRLQAGDEFRDVNFSHGVGDPFGYLYNAKYCQLMAKEEWELKVEVGGGIDLGGATDVVRWTNFPEFLCPNGEFDDEGNPL